MDHDPIRALIVVDVQRDFCEGGSLAVQGGAQVASAISNALLSHGLGWSLVVATRDHHIDPGAHFSNDPNYVDSWPPHCVVGTAGVEFHPNLNQEPIAAIFDKGEYAAAYSGFEGRNGAGESLADWLHARRVDEVEIVGIATDYCVRATALDAVREGFATTVLLEMTAGVSPGSTKQAVTELQTAGVGLVGEPTGG